MNSALLLATFRDDSAYRGHTVVFSDGEGFAWGTGDDIGSLDILALERAGVLIWTSPEVREWFYSYKDWAVGRAARFSEGAIPIEVSFSHGVSDDEVEDDDEAPYLEAQRRGTELAWAHEYEEAAAWWAEAERLATDPVDRHYLYDDLVKYYYARRDRGQSFIDRFVAHCQSDLELFRATDLATRLAGAGVHYATSLHRYATWLEKQGDYSTAIRVSKVAVSLGLTDGTQKDFAGRIPRLEKKLTTGATPSVATRRPATKPRKRTLVDPSDTWIALDFETATAERVSACSLGVAVVQNGAVISSGAWLIQPPGNVYDPRNIQVHGITPRHTRRTPTFVDLYDAVVPFLENRCVLAHWAEFDISVLRALHQFYGLPLPQMKYSCSCRMAQRAFPRLSNHRLPTVCSHCGIALTHHDAASDAVASALVALSCRDAVGAQSIHDAIGALGMRAKNL
jgi:DNA polymerase III subunit epsilon